MAEEEPREIQPVSFGEPDSRDRSQIMDFRPQAVYEDEEGEETTSPDPKDLFAQEPAESSALATASEESPPKSEETVPVEKDSTKPKVQRAGLPISSPETKAG